MFWRPLAACYTPGEMMKTVLSTQKLVEPLPVPFWSWCSISQFHHSRLTTLHTQISLVSLGHRISCRSAGLARGLAPLSAGFPPQRMPFSDAGRFILASLLRRGSLEQHHSTLKGALLKVYDVLGGKTNAPLCVPTPNRVFAGMTDGASILPERASQTPSNIAIVVLDSCSS